MKSLREEWNDDVYCPNHNHTWKLKDGKKDHCITCGITIGEFEIGLIFLPGTFGIPFGRLLGSRKRIARCVCNEYYHNWLYKTHKFSCYVCGKDI